MKQQTQPRPSVEELEQEIRRVKYKQRYNSILRSTVFTLITVAAVAVLVATLWLPVLQIFGNSMTPTLENGEIIFSTKNAQLEQGDIVAFYYNNKILIKRVVATSGDWVDMDPDGTVYVNDRELEEPYLTDKDFGGADIEFPYQVPEGKYFVLGDHRATSVDSRHTSVGCVSEEQLVGKILLRIWPLNRITWFG